MEAVASSRYSAYFALFVEYLSRHLATPPKLMRVTLAAEVQVLCQLLSFTRSTYKQSRSSSEFFVVFHLVGTTFSVTPLSCRQSSYNTLRICVNGSYVECMHHTDTVCSHYNSRKTPRRSEAVKVGIFRHILT